MPDSDPDDRTTSGLVAKFDAPPAEIVDLYDTWTAEGEYDRDVEEWGYDAPQRIADMTLTALARIPGEVLDAGCGTGRVGAALAARGVADVRGGDFSPTSVAAAVERDVYTTVQHLDLNQPLEFADGQFAVTVSAGVFSYLSDTYSTIRELLRVVCPGGSVLFTQRTDLWDAKDCGAMIERIVHDGECTAAVSAPMPYLPLHPDFGDTIGIRYVTLVASG